MYKNGIEIRLLVNGRPMREYSYNGSVFYESRHGSKYTIKIKNDNSYRVMAVVSVDGLDVITGKPAEKSNKGYIVDAYSSTEIKGYRLSDTDSAAFVFVSKDKSYTASATGDSRNSGVIGIRVFQEKEEKPKMVEKHIHHHHNYYKNPWNPYPYNPAPIWISAGIGVTGSIGSCGVTTTGTSNASTVVSNVSYGAGGQSINAQNFVAQSGGTTSAATYASSINSKFDLSNMTEDYYIPVKGPSPGVSTRAVDNSFDSPITYDSFDTGTSWGQKQSDKVKKEYFKRGKMVGELVFYYASAEALVNMGIDLTDTPKIAEMPKAFGNSEYCQPPKGWNG